MRAVKLKKENLFDFLEAIKPFGDLWAPVKHGDNYVLDRTEDYSRIELGALRTKLPFKKLLFPPQFTMFQFDEKGISAPAEEPPKQILFGLHPCDIHALLIMDHFHDLHFPDPYYKIRRERTAVIGLSCIPDEYCFCKTTNTHYSEKGFDIALTDLGKFFILWIGSSLGDDMVRACPELVDEKVDHKDLKEYVAWREYRESQFKLEMDFTGMPSIMELSYDTSLWDELGEKCLACGACTIVCPTCPCFNVKDHVDLTKTSGKRVRHWDSCTYREYSMVAGGHNFREAKAERLKLRFIHKLQAFVGAFGEPACVGCGRCIENCPVDIDIRTVSLRLKGEEVKE